MLSELKMQMAKDLLEERNQCNNHLELIQNRIDMIEQNALLQEINEMLQEELTTTKNRRSEIDDIIQKEFGVSVRLLYDEVYGKH
jgi:flagellar motor component MotA